MATPLDNVLPAKVVEILAKYGKTVTWTVSTGGTVDASAGKIVGATETPHTVKVSPPEPYTSRFIDGDVILAGDAKVVLAAQSLAFTPAAGQKLTIDGEVWRVVAVNRQYSGELVAAWEAQVRR